MQYQKIEKKQVFSIQKTYCVLIINLWKRIDDLRPVNTLLIYYNLSKCWL